MTQLVDSCLPSTFCIGYGGSINPNNQLCIGSSSSFNSSNSLMVAASLSPPSSPSSSQSSHSLELLDSSPPCSSLAETFPYDLWAVNAPTLDTPPPFDHNCLAQASLSTRKRTAAAASALEELSHLEASPMLLPKRLCETTAWDCSRACSSRDASTSMILNEINANSHNNALISGDFGPSMEDGSALCTDLEDVLDLLLQDAEAARAEPSPIGHGRSAVDWEDGLKRASKPPDCNYIGMQKGAGEARATLQELLSGQQRINTRAPQSFEDLKQKVSSAHHQQQYSSRWAGPTLLDIESALALTGSPASATSHPSISSPLGEPLKSCWSIRDILKEETVAHTCKEEPLLEEDDRMSTWRRLHKRNHVEPRYTVKIRCEEDAVSDGYRWRKYGQKSIKNSPYPRSYYRCSSGNCSVKKQVERCVDDAGLLLVTYEGIHLHHRPNALGCPQPWHASSSSGC